MRKRDLAILLLSAFAIFFTLQHEGDFSFKEAWFHLSDDYPIKYEAERLPPPIVADLNGDGRSEVLVATHDAKIQVLAPHARRVDEGFSESRVLAEVSLLPDKVRVSSGRRAVAMATGFVDRIVKRGTPRKQVLVVVTSGWLVMCFDHNLKKLWESNLQEDFPHGAHHMEIAISISNYTLKHADAGLVIVGGRMERQPHIYMDPFEEVGEEPKNSEKHRRSASEKEASDNSGTVDLRHFAFYAFAGRTGTLRWSRKTENIQLHSSDASQLIPQHNYKLDAHALNSRQPGEFECREFRESILGVMPHRWDRREDTSFELAHFRSHKRKSMKKTPGKSSNYPFHKPEENHPPGKDTTNKIPKLIGKAKNYAGSAKTKKRKVCGVHGSTKPHLVVEASTGSDAVQVYKAAFGAEELKREMHTKRKAEQELPLILKAELKVGSSVFIVADHSEGSPALSGGSFWLETNDVNDRIRVEMLVALPATLQAVVERAEQIEKTISAGDGLEGASLVGPSATPNLGLPNRSEGRPPTSPTGNSRTIFGPTKSPFAPQQTTSSVVSSTTKSNPSSSAAVTPHVSPPKLKRLTETEAQANRKLGLCYRCDEKYVSRSTYVPTITNYTKLWWVPNVVVAHQKEGIEAVHLASGRTICKSWTRRLASGPNWNKVTKARAVIERVKLEFNFYFFGMSYQLHLQEGGLHADINGDGVLDHVQWPNVINVYCITICPIVENPHPSSVNLQLCQVQIWSKQQSISFPKSSLLPERKKSKILLLSSGTHQQFNVVGSNGAEQAVVSGSMEVLRPCWAVATSGVPVREQLFNASICHHHHFNLFHGRAMDASSLEVATPILVQTKDGHRHRKGSHGDVVFLTNRGEVTSYAPGLHGHGADWRWQLLTGATWSNLPSPAGMVEAGMVVPTLKVIPLGRHDHQQVILAAGDQEAVVLSPGGSQLTTLDLPAPPTHALICEDFSNDGLTDIILVTSNGVYGFVQTRQPGALFFSTLLGCLIIIMGVIFVSQHLNSVKGKPRATTDYR
ncbi:hypothetical protein Syun_005173 [Stephania yunnanensis]|uniref:Glyoxalase At5g48480-like N-terminal domain-containing protein n=1 Tax=Stephania yunnanensis TaxID=152371 RepID=A0AAP0L4M2_9MAGN